MVPSRRSRGTLLALSLTSAAAGCADTPLRESPVRIENAVEDCLLVAATGEFVRNNVRLLDAELTPVKSTGYCGCKSAILSYYVPSASGEPAESGRFSSLRAGPVTFVLDRDLDVATPGPDALRIQCAAPD